MLKSIYCVYKQDVSCTVFYHFFCCLPSFCLNQDVQDCKIAGYLGGCWRGFASRAVCFVFPDCFRLRLCNDECILRCNYAVRHNILAEKLPASITERTVRDAILVKTGILSLALIQIYFIK
jgi:hypothetical protein